MCVGGWPGSALSGLSGPIGACVASSFACIQAIHPREKASWRGDCDTGTGWVGGRGRWHGEAADSGHERGHGGGFARGAASQPASQPPAQPPTLRSSSGVSSPPALPTVSCHAWSTCAEQAAGKGPERCVRGGGGRCRSPASQPQHPTFCARSLSSPLCLSDSSNAWIFFFSSSSGACSGEGARGRRRRQTVGATKMSAHTACCGTSSLTLTFVARTIRGRLVARSRGLGARAQQRRCGLDGLLMVREIILVVPTTGETIGQEVFLSAAKWNCLGGRGSGPEDKTS